MKDTITKYKELVDRRNQIQLELEPILIEIAEFEEKVLPKILGNETKNFEFDGLKIKRDIKLLFNPKDLTEKQVKVLENFGLKVSEDYVLNPSEIERVLKINEKYKQKYKEDLMLINKKVHSASVKKVIKENEKELKSIFNFKVTFKS